MSMIERTSETQEIHPSLLDWCTKHPDWFEKHQGKLFLIDQRTDQFIRDRQTGEPVTFSSKDKSIEYCQHYNIQGPITVDIVGKASALPDPFAKEIGYSGPLFVDERIHALIMRFSQSTASQS